MKKVSLLILVSLILLLAFTSCDLLPESVTGIFGGSHEHKWTEATCTSPKSCECGATEGEALGHDWTAATCTSAKTCKTCNATEGEAAGHDFADATCTSPKTCKDCGVTTGKANGHDWDAPDCTSPATCKVCGVEGDAALGHKYVYDCDWRCSVCGELTRPLAKHDLVLVAQVDSTCTEYGTAMYVYCKICDGKWLDLDLTKKFEDMNDLKLDTLAPHEYEYECSTECSNCDEGTREAEHKYTSECDETCEYCSEERETTVDHTYTLPCDAWCSVCYENTNPNATHTLVHVEAKESTCVEYGNIEYWYCEHCLAKWDNDKAEGMTLTRGMEIIMEYGDHEYTADCDTTCENCDATREVETPHTYALPCDAWCSVCYENTNPNATHTLSGHVEAVAPTCSADGNIEYWYCEHCGIKFDNPEGTGMALFRGAEIDFNRPDHEYTADCDTTCENCDATREVETPHTYTLPCDAWCAVCYENTNPNATHTLSGHVEAVAPTCNADGNIEYWYCEHCGVKFDNPEGTGMALFRGAEIDFNRPAHEYTYDCDKNCKNCGEETRPEADHNYGEATCTEAGTCEYCGLSTGEPIGCTWGEYVYNEGTATCTEDGTETAKCIRCDETDTRIKEGSKLGHDLTAHEGVESTCTVNGHKAYETCSRCDYTTYEELPLADHVPAEAVVEGRVESTCSVKGGYDLVTYCSVCGTEKMNSEHVELELNPVAHSNFGHAYADGVMTYTCADCEYSYSCNMGQYKADGFSGISDKETDATHAQENRSRFTYEPFGRSGGGIAGFSTGANAEGALSFTVNAFNDGRFIVQFVEAAEGAASWTPEYCMMENVLEIKPPVTHEDGTITVDVTGWGAEEGTQVLKTITVTADNMFTGDIAVNMQIKLDSATDTMTINYYLDGKYVHTASRILTTKNNSIPYVYISSDTWVKGSGYTITDLYCGFNHTHTWIDADCDTPKHCACGATEGVALGHVWNDYNCSTAKSCSRCGYVAAEPNPLDHVLSATYADSVLTYSCSACDYSFSIENGKYADGSNYNGMSANDSRNDDYFSSNGSKLPAVVTDEETGNKYYSFIRNDSANGTATQLQLWVPTTDTTSDLGGFNSGNRAEGYFSFSINAFVDYACSWKLIDATLGDCVDMDGDGVVTTSPRDASLNPDFIRWTDYWAINDPVFQISTPSNGVVTVKGFNNSVLKTVATNDWTGWFDVAIKLELDPDQDLIIAHYYIDGRYVTTQTRPITTLSNAITGVYINGQYANAGSGYMLDNLAYGYTPHHHDTTPTIANGMVTYSCECGMSYTVASEYLEWDGEGTDSPMNHTPNGAFNRDPIINDDGTWSFMFTPTQDSDWGSYGDQKGGQVQPWMPASTRTEDVFTDFSCEANAVGIISFKVKTSITRHADRDTSISFGVGKPRNASDWDDGGSWADDQIAVLTIEDYLESGTVVKGGLANNGGLNLTLATIPAGGDGWSEWFDVVISISMKDDGTMSVYYYINGVYCGSDTKNIVNGSGRILNPQKIEALQISGWTFAANTGIMFDDMIFGYTAGGHNTLDGQVHVIPENATCSEAATCSCGYTGILADHNMADATCGTPAYCKDCGITVGEPHDCTNVNVTYADGIATVTCVDCGVYYTLDGGCLYNDGSSTLDTFIGTNGEFTQTNVNGEYNKITMTNADGEFFNANGDQFMQWIPSASNPANFHAFSCENNAVGVVSLKIKAFTDSSTGLEIKLVAERGDSGWQNINGVGDQWDDCSFTLLRIGQVTEGATTVALKDMNNAEFMQVAIDSDKWTDWLDVKVLVKLTSDGNMTLDYFINGQLVKTLSNVNMPIHTKRITALYINGYSKSTGSGYCIDDFVFGYTTNGMQGLPELPEVEVETPLYNSVIDAEEVTSDTLKTIVAGKIKQVDQANPNSDPATNNDYFVEGGTPVYVKANKDGAEVEALYFSRSVEWLSGSQNAGWSEFRVATDSSKLMSSITFDYLVKGTLGSSTEESDDGIGALGTSYVQIKDGSGTYIDLANSAMVADGEWHTMTLDIGDVNVTNVLFKLYHFQGEMLFANLVINYAE